MVKAANGDDYESEFKFLEASYCLDVDTGTLPGQLSVLEAMLKISCFDDFLVGGDEGSKPGKKLVQEVQTTCWLLAVNAATYAAGKRSFSSAQPLKT